MNDETKINVNNLHNDDETTEWQLCCSHSSKAFIKYMVTVVMSIIILLFCIIMIIKSAPDEDNSIYFSLISSILTLYVPSPTLSLNKK